ncbi:MAG: hypothetical protein WDO74_16430 [Pseudomonadota bacterium]
MATALLVDTDADSRVSLCKLLTESHIRTVVATNSIAALAVLRSQQIDILICEDLGGLYGVEILEACEALFPSVRRVYLARKASAELHCETMVRGHVHATISDWMHPIDLRNTIASLVGQ